MDITSSRPTTQTTTQHVYKPFESSTKNYFSYLSRNITRTDCSFNSVTAKVSIAALPMILLLTLLADLIKGISYCICGPKIAETIVDTISHPTTLTHKPPQIAIVEDEVPSAPYIPLLVGNSRAMHRIEISEDDYRHCDFFSPLPKMEAISSELKKRVASSRDTDVDVDVDYDSTDSEKEEASPFVSETQAALILKAEAILCGIEAALPKLEERVFLLD